VAVVEAVIGYEWLLSALDKILSPTFRSGLAKQVVMNMQGNPNSWWVALTRRLVLPHAQLFALLVEVGEMLVALGLFAGALLWVSGQFPRGRWAHRLNLGVIGALLGGALMTANYYVMAGNTLPGLNPGAPFDEGLSLDGVLTLIAVGLLAIHVIPLWARRARQDAPEA
jgi:thiosulfate dehydrogenase [quinone] large subunit